MPIYKHFTNYNIKYNTIWYISYNYGYPVKR